MQGTEEQEVVTPEATCEATATIEIGRFTEADVTCGKELHDEEDAHVATQHTKTKDGGYARIVYIWS